LLQADFSWLCRLAACYYSLPIVLKFGTVEAIKEYYRAEGGAQFIENMVQDVRQSCSPDHDSLKFHVQFPCAIEVTIPGVH
jgi:hypothetical protein